MMRLPPLATRRSGQQQRTQSMSIPAPTKGIVAVDMYGFEGNAVDPSAAIYIYNMIAGEFGCRVRRGSREYAINVLDKADNPGEVRSLLYYNSVEAGGANDKFFAVTDKGIWDITGGTDTPTLAHEWANQTDTAGWCSTVNYTNTAGNHYLLICDEANGYWIYNGTTFTQGTFTGSPKPNAEDLVQITEWNGVIWLVERNSARAWYLDPLSLTGDIEDFDVGSRFVVGGHLAQMTTWTIDDGAGMDDKLVMLSAAGDLLVWAGLGPTNMQVVGRWQTGTVPEGRRVMSEWGGDVMIMTAEGLIRLSDILQGVGSTDPNRFLTYNIARYVRDRMNTALDEWGWQLVRSSDDGISIFIVPDKASSTDPPIQFVMDNKTGAWSIFRGLDMVTGIDAADGYYFGTRDGKIMQMVGTVDNGSYDGLSSDAIDFSLLTHYTSMGSPSTWKRPQFKRLWWLGDADPAYRSKVLFDFKLNQYLEAPVFTGDNIALWDAALWDIDKWDATAQSYWETKGSAGIGRHVALAFRGESALPTSYLGCDIMLDQGGML